MGKLTAEMVARARRGALPAGRYRDDDGLILVAHSSGGSWILRYQLNGRRRDLGLGAVKLLSLAQARELAQRRRFEIRVNKVDPLEQRDQTRSRSITFAAAAEQFLSAHSAGWKGAGMASAWRQSIRDHVTPIVGTRTVDRIDTAMVMQILQPLWTTRTATAAKVRSRVERILSWCIVQGFRAGENPARWRGHLDQLLPSSGRVARRVHHAAVPAEEMGAVWKRLRGRDELDLGALVVQFQVLTACRPGEALGARWAEIDRKGRIWTIPSERMKTGREHIVPLCTQALAVLEAVRGLDGDRAFASVSRDTARRTLKAAGGGNATLHGMRSLFDGWAHQSGYASILVDLALSHVVGSATVQAYRRDPMIEPRRAMMQAWGDHLG